MGILLPQRRCVRSDQQHARSHRRLPTWSTPEVPRGVRGGHAQRPVSQQPCGRRRAQHARLCAPLPVAPGTTRHSLAARGGRPGRPPRSSRRPRRPPRPSSGRSAPHRGGDVREAQAQWARRPLPVAPPAARPPTPARGAGRGPSRRLRVFGRHHPARGGYARVPPRSAQRGRVTLWPTALRRSVVGGGPATDGVGLLGRVTSHLPCRRWRGGAEQTTWFGEVSRAGAGVQTLWINGVDALVGRAVEWDGKRTEMARRPRADKTPTVLGGN